MASSIKDVNAIMDFHKKILLLGLEDRPITEEDFEKAKEAARRLNEDEMWNFDLSDKTSFCESVIEFSRSFFK